MINPIEIIKQAVCNYLEESKNLDPFSQPKLAYSLNTKEINIAKKLMEENDLILILVKKLTTTESYIYFYKHDDGNFYTIRIKKDHEPSVISII